LVTVQRPLMYIIVAVDLVAKFTKILPQLAEQVQRVIFRFFHKPPPFKTIQHQV
jgi:hypothetical protein